MQQSPVSSLAFCGAAKREDATIKLEKTDLLIIAKPMGCIVVPIIVKVEIICNRYFSPEESILLIVKKKSFLLLEILIGLVLIELIAIPLLKKPITAYRAEIRFFEDAEGERLADIAFLEIKEKLITNAIPWEALPGPGEAKHFSLPPTILQIPGFPPKEIQRAYTLKCHKRHERTGKNQELYRFLHVEIELHPYLKRKKSTQKKEIPYKYKTSVQRT